MILTDSDKVNFLENNFHEYFDITISSDVEEESISGFVNIVMPISKIDDFYNLSEIRSLFNSNFNNVIFTSSDDESIVHKYEVYRNTFFIRISPFTHNIRMHILPKEFDGSNEKTNPILFFKESKETIDESNFQCTKRYERFNDRRPINLYYKESTKKTSEGIYKFDIKEKAKNLTKIQINSCYSYNDTNPTNEINHYTGILDESDENGNKTTNLTEYNISLMDANYDNISTFTNVIKAQKLRDNEINWPIDTNPYPDNNTGFNNPHDIETKYYKTIKYFNDDIYIEEGGNVIMADWKESLIRG